jgi:N-acetylmuramoyl-L-alanine amidase
VAVIALAVQGAPARAGERVVEHIRYYVHDGYTRVVLDVSGPSQYRVSGHRNPERIAINIQDARAGRALRNVTVGDGGIKRVRVNRLSWGTQVVLDLDGEASWKHFTLASSGRKSDRIVLDVTPAGTAPAVTAARRPRSRAVDDAVYIVAIDAGHGGKDRGTTGHGLVEKELTLDIARRVAAGINAHDGYKAVLTRSRDVYLTLPRRVELAEQMGADLFVSIHLNSAPNRAARGSEVFFLSPSGARRTASRILSDPDQAAHELGLRGEASSDVLHMLVDVNQQAVLQRSEDLAESILQEITRPGLMRTRAVKQKSFAVLRNIRQPSVLIECGFLSNRYDAALFKDSKGRDLVANGIAKGIRGYLQANPLPRESGRPVVVHRVRRGDTLWKLSREYGSSIASIRELNRLSSSVLQVGQELLVYDRY